jgi:hypothetical protein
MSIDNSSPSTKIFTFFALNRHIPSDLLLTVPSFFHHRCEDSAPNTYRGSSRLRQDCKDTFLCDLEIISYPRTVLIKRRGYETHPQLVPGSGKGQNLLQQVFVGAGWTANQTLQATGQYRHSISNSTFLVYTGALVPERDDVACSYPYMFQLGVRSNPSPHCHRKNFCWSNASLFFRIKYTALPSL